MADRDLYDTDIVAWADQQVSELRRLAIDAPSNAVDWHHLIEEIEGVGRSQVNGVERKLALILAHLIKVVSAPDSPALRGWRSEIGSFQRMVRKQFSPSMRQLIDWQEVWSDARSDAEAALRDWGDDIVRNLPERNPVALDDVLARDFDLDGIVSKLAEAVSTDRPA